MESSQHSRSNQLGFSGFCTFYGAREGSDAEISSSVQNVQDEEEPSDLDVSVHRCGLSCPDQPFQLGATVVLGLGRQFLDVHICGEQVEAFHLVGVDVEDLDTPLLIRQTWRSEDESVGEFKVKLNPRISFLF